MADGYPNGVGYGNALKHLLSTQLGKLLLPNLIMINLVYFIGRLGIFY